jgi:tryptophan synthase alpha chain
VTSWRWESRSPTLAWIFGELEKAGGFDAPLVMMSYLNPLLAFGYERLADRALETGVCAFIVPDLPFEESDEIRAALEAKGLGLIQLVTPATPQRIRIRGHHHRDHWRGRGTAR